MAIIKKKDLYGANISELINVDGSPIEGDERYETTSQINVGVDKAGSGEPAQTMDKFVQGARQGNRYNYGPQGLGNATHHMTVVDDSGLNFDAKDNEVEESVSLDEIAKDKMTKMVEDIITSKSIGRDMVKKTSSPDVNQNKIPDIDELRQIKPVSANSAIKFVNQLNSEPLVGDEKAIMLNYLLSNLNMMDISPEYKTLLKNKF